MFRQAQHENNNTMSKLTITDLWIYPIKSIGGIQLTSSKVEHRGLQYDRRWVLADLNGMFISQREFPELALLQPSIEGDTIIIQHKQKDLAPLTFSTKEPDSNPINVTVWDDTMPAKPVSEKASQWFSDYIGKPAQLLYMHNDSIRQADQRYAINESDKVSFADGYPILIISEESLEQLNSLASEEVPMGRFRANVIVKGGEAHIEDRVKRLKVGETEWHGVKPCARCVMTTIDLDTAQKRREPLLTLSKYRRVKSKILFGENFIPMSEGQVEVGQELSIDLWKEPAIKQGSISIKE